jgi:hypothetical protein
MRAIGSDSPIRTLDLNRNDAGSLTRQAILEVLQNNWHLTSIELKYNSIEYHYITRIKHLLKINENEKYSLESRQLKAQFLMIQVFKPSIRLSQLCNHKLTLQKEVA